MNSVVISGTIGFEPKIYSTNTGKQYSSFSVAMSEERSGKSFVTYVNVSAWGQLCEKSMALKKGDLVLVSGKLSSQKKGEQWTLSVMANQLEIIASEQKEVPQWHPPETELIKDEDVPF